MLFFLYSASLIASAADNAISESTAFVITPVAAAIYPITLFSTSAAFLNVHVHGTFSINLLLDFNLVSRTRHL